MLDIYIWQKFNICQSMLKSCWLVLLLNGIDLHFTIWVCVRKHYAMSCYHRESWHEQSLMAHYVSFWRRANIQYAIVSQAHHLLLSQVTNDLQKLRSFDIETEIPYMPGDRNTILKTLLRPVPELEPLTWWNICWLVTIIRPIASHQRFRASACRHTYTQ